jgi:hypothetical protein
MDESSLSQTGQEGQLSDRWDVLLAKYIRVWIWSLLFGAASALGYSYVGFQLDKPWGSLAVLPLALLLIGVASSLGAWWSLLRYLRGTILPEFFGLSDRDESDDPREREWRNYRAGRVITRAYVYLLIAGLTRLLISASELLFEALRGGPSFR